MTEIITSFRHPPTRTELLGPSHRRCLSRPSSRSPFPPCRQTSRQTSPQKRVPLALRGVHPSHGHGRDRVRTS